MSAPKFKWREPSSPQPVDVIALMRRHVNATKIICTCGDVRPMADFHTIAAAICRNCYAGFVK